MAYDRYVFEGANIDDDVPQSLSILHRLRTKQNSWIGERRNCVAHCVVMERRLLLRRETLPGEGAVFDPHNDAAAIDNVSKGQNILHEQITIPAHRSFEL